MLGISSCAEKATEKSYGTVPGVMGCFQVITKTRYFLVVSQSCHFANDRQELVLRGKSFQDASEVPEEGRDNILRLCLQSTADV